MNKIEIEIQKILGASTTELLVELREWHLRGPYSQQYLTETYEDLKDSDDSKVQEIIEKYYAPDKRVAFQQMKVTKDLMLEMLYVEMACVIQAHPQLFE